MSDDKSKINDDLDNLLEKCKVSDEFMNDLDKLGLSDEEKQKAIRLRKLRELENKSVDVPKIIVWSLILFIFIFIVIKVTSFENDVDEYKKPTKTDAYIQTKSFVKEKLKSPASAEFGLYNPENVMEVNDSTFTVTGTVDSQNSFGALIRANFSYEVIYHKDKSWTGIGTVN